MIDTVKRYINQYNMLDDCEVIVVGVSGGADSVCLLFLLEEILKDTEIVLEVLHVNHGIRETAKRDEDFVRDLCAQKNIPFHIASADVHKIAKESSLTVEEAGRMIRYDALRKVLGTRYGKIAVAHNADDNAETMLLNLFRGTGINGLSGIKPVNDEIIRPILCLEKKDILKFLADRNISYVTDETNLTDDYTRNKIRHHILGYATEEIGEGIINNMNRASKMISDASSFLDSQVYKIADECMVCSDDSKISFDIDLLSKQHDYAVSKIIYDGICMMAHTRKDISYEHVNEVRKLFQSSGSADISLPYGLRAYRTYNLLTISGCLQNEKSEEEKISVNTQILTDFNISEIPKGNYTKWFDYDKISNALEVRTRKDGDYLIIDSKGHKQLLSDYMINQKIPLAKRDNILLLADNSHIIWVIGYRISEYYKVTDETKRVLEASFIN